MRTFDEIRLYEVSLVHESAFPGAEVRIMDDSIYSNRPFSKRVHDEAKKKGMCICAHFGPRPKCEAKPPYNRSCPFHGERER